MGKLLSSAIKMQNGAVAAPTLTINFTDFSGGAGSTDVYKNGSYYASAVSGVPLIVPIVAGNTFYVVVTPPFLGIGSWQYYVNATLTASGGGTSPTYTASGTNIYSFTTFTDSEA
jgi:hypothetical protein